MHQLALQPNEYGHEQLLKEERSAASGECLGWHLMSEHAAGDAIDAGGASFGDITTRLNQLAGVMRDAGLAGAWRNEQLTVRDTHGKQVGTIERAAVRPLGITTLAVHLVGQTPDGRFWVQQRALNKSNDPGLWDTLMGGMVSSSDTVETALTRETWEEAGLHVADLQDVRYGGRLSTNRPERDGGGAGYISEQIDWYCCTVPDGMQPVNQDGEVEQFCQMDATQLLEAMQQGKFTLEAALILADVMSLQARAS